MFNHLHHDNQPLDNGCYNKDHRYVSYNQIITMQQPNQPQKQWPTGTHHLLQSRTSSKGRRRWRRGSEERKELPTMPRDGSHGRKDRSTPNQQDHGRTNTTLNWMTTPGPTQVNNNGTGASPIPIGLSEWTRIDLYILIIINIINLYKFKV